MRIVGHCELGRDTASTMGDARTLTLGRGMQAWLEARRPVEAAAPAA